MENTRIHVRHFGQGARQVLAIHCTLANAGAWRGVAEAMADRATFIAIDLPDHGRSGAWGRANDLHGLCTRMARAQLTRPMDVIGHSFGATVALRLAVEVPQLVRTLTLIEPVFFAVAMADAPEIMAAHHEDSDDFTKALVAGEMEAAARHFIHAWGVGDRWEDIPAARRQQLAEQMHFVAGQSPLIFEDNARLLATGAMQRADMPCLILQGDRSPPVIDAINAGLARRLPRAVRATIPAAGHMAPITHPAAVAAEITTLFELAQE